MSYVIAEPCIDVKDKACASVCPVDCIHEADRMLYIDPDSCTWCGACEAACPVAAIFYADDLPQQWRDFKKLNELLANDTTAGNAEIARRYPASS